jgi:hypothetical protein
VPSPEELVRTSFENKRSENVSETLLWILVAHLAFLIDFKSSHFDPILCFASDLIKWSGLEIYSSPHNQIWNITYHTIPYMIFQNPTTIAFQSQMHLSSYFVNWLSQRSYLSNGVLLQ